MEAKKKREGKKTRGISAGIVLVCCFIVAISVYFLVFGNPDNFVNGDPNNHPLQGNMLGTIYKGGPVVCLIITLLLTVLVLSVERFFAIGKAKGKGNLINFVYDVKAELQKGNVKGAEALCDKQKGSVAAIISAGLKKYADMETTTEELSKEQKIVAIQQNIEEATALELPSMEQNLPVIATISTLGTLFGLLGTVIGMIRSFSALANEGAPDSVALAAGISEAL
ncbi:MAG: MotA/TolQ/ExbB proton channel family protein, partial [Dysgonamonadaceae bacterium]|nr:MotA/TolQ/ExbB proton channel family protein [Dysgonamonadaceae bacterium]